MPDKKVIRPAVAPCTHTTISHATRVTRFIQDAWPQST